MKLTKRKLVALWKASGMWGVLTADGTADERRRETRVRYGRVFTWMYRMDRIFWEWLLVWGVLTADPSS